MLGFILRQAPAGRSADMHGGIGARQTFPELAWTVDGACQHYRGLSRFPVKPTWVLQCGHLSREALLRRLTGFAVFRFQALESQSFNHLI